MSNQSAASETSLSRRAASKRLRTSVWPVIFLLITATLIALQFTSQLQDARNGWYTQWPLRWDENRFTDYACFYLDAYEQSGLTGVFHAYRQRPPYSVTLLATSLPFLLITRDPVTLHFSMIVYYLLLDLGLFFITWRLSRNFNLSLLSVLTAHFATFGVVSWSSINRTVEAIRYQLNFPSAVLAIAMTAVLLKGTNTARPRLWALALLLLTVGTVLLRAGALPYFLAVTFPPAVFLYWQLRQMKQYQTARCAALALILAALILGVHLYHIWEPMIWYIQFAQSNPAFRASTLARSLTFYLWRGLKASPLFPVALAAVSATAISLFMRFRTIIHRKRRLNSLTRRALTTWLLTAYMWTLVFVLPTISLTKNRRIGDAFLLLTFVFAIASLPRLFRRTGRPCTLLRRRLTPAFVVLALAGAAFNVHAEWGRRETALAQVKLDPYRKTKLRLRKVYLATVQFSRNWIKENQRNFIVIGFPTQKNYFYEKHSFRILSHLTGIPRIDVQASEILPRGDEFLKRGIPVDRAAEVLFIPAPDKDPRMKTIYAKFNFLWLSTEEQRIAEQHLASAGYRLIGEAPVSPRLNLNVYQLANPVTRQPYGFP